MLSKLTEYLIQRMQVEMVAKKVFFFFVFLFFPVEPEMNGYLSIYPQDNA